MEKTNKTNENAVKNEAKTIVKTIVKTEAQTKTAEEMQKEIEQKSKELQKCLQELQRKQKLSDNRTVFLHVLDQLEGAENRLKEEEGFDSNQVKVKFIDVMNYRNDEVFSIGNKSIILDFIIFTREKINARIAEIEKQLVS